MSGKSATVDAAKATGAVVSKPSGRVHAPRQGHPKYSEMVHEAISALKDRHGSSRQAIQKYIQANFFVGHNDKRAAAQLRMALKRGVASGALTQVKGAGASGSFLVAKAQPAEAKKNPAKTKAVVQKKKTAEADAHMSPKVKAKAQKKPVKAKSPKSPKTKAPKSPKSKASKSPRAMKAAAKTHAEVAVARKSATPKKAPKAGKADPMAKAKKPRAPDASKTKRVASPKMPKLARNPKRTPKKTFKTVAEKKSA